MRTRNEIIISTDEGIKSAKAIDAIIAQLLHTQMEILLDIRDLLIESPRRGRKVLMKEVSLNEKEQELLDKIESHE